MSSAHESLKSPRLPEYFQTSQSIFLFLMGVVFVLFVFTFTYAADKSAYIHKMRTNSGFSEDVTAQFRTDFSKTSISPGDLVNGGPGKDGIPALVNPKFVKATEANLNAGQEGILLNEYGVTKFYPLNIMVWHEVVNDSVDNYPIVVTYSPLTGTAAIYKRVLGDAILEFGVSGLLKQANMIMYDRKSESLWSQSTGMSVAGYYNKAALERMNTQIIKFGDLKKEYSDAWVLSTETGYTRDYSSNPYMDYEKVADIPAEFQVTGVDSVNHPKTRMYVFPLEVMSVAIRTDDITAGKSGNFDVYDSKVKIQNTMGMLQASVLDVNTNQWVEVPGYYEMWFSWSLNHKEDGTVIGNSSERLHQ